MENNLKTGGSVSILKKLLSGGDKHTKPERVWRESRIRLEAFHRVGFRDGQNKHWKVSNVSTTGTGLITETASRHPVGHKLEGHLEIGTTRYPVELEVRHVTDKILGCRFLGMVHEIRQAIEGYLNAEILALKMNKIDPSVLAPHPAGQVHWFTDGRANEVHFVTTEDKLVNFHISFLGNYLEGAPDVELRFGQIIDDRNSSKPGHKSANLIEFFEQVPDEAVPLALRIVNNLQGLKPAERAALIACLNYQR